MVNNMTTSSRPIAMSAPLAVARIPSLVREVDVIVQTFAASRLPTDPRDVVELCESLLTRINEIDAFRQSLRPGPLEAIVQKQSVRLSMVLESLHPECVQPNEQIPSSVRSPIVLVDTRRRRQLTPIHGTLLIQRTRNSSMAPPGSASKQVTVRLPRHPKPMYKWEKRRPLYISPSHTGPHAHNELMDDDATEASTELKPCAEPGHYMRLHMGGPLQADTPHTAFEFQIILTAAEVQALKFQRRQLEAEQRHLKRQQIK